LRVEKVGWCPSRGGGGDGRVTRLDVLLKKEGAMAEFGGKVARA